MGWYIFFLVLKQKIKLLKDRNKNFLSFFFFFTFWYSKTGCSHFQSKNPNEGPAEAAAADLPLFVGYSMNIKSNENHSKKT